MKRLRILSWVLIGIAGCTTDSSWHIWSTQGKEEAVELVNQHPDVFPFAEYVDIEKAIDDFHVTDVDQDGDLDLIYSGWSGAESDVTCFYLNNKGTYTEALRLWGKVEAVTRLDEHTVEIAVRQDPCCGDFEVRKRKYSVGISKDVMQERQTDLLIGHEMTSQPNNRFDHPIPFVVKQVQYHLRVTPAIDTSEYYFPADDQGNIYCSYTRGDSGMAYGEEEDETGRIWWYVEMNPSEEVSRLDDDDQRFYPRMAGWMSSRFLERE